MADAVQPTIVTANIVIAASRERCFAVASSTELLPRIFPGSGAVPGVISARMEHDLPFAVGNTRLVQLTDGTEARETYMDVSPPASYGYRMSEIQGLMGKLLTHAEGAWAFTATADGGTQVGWTYRAYPSSEWTRPAAWLAVNMFLSSAMQNCLAQVKTIAETE
jgi:uncharacterized protein YndB with AHSA1/START domain